MARATLAVAAADARAASRIRADRVGKAYGSANGDTPTSWAIRDVSFEVEEGEFFILLGPSGCGKSTLLRLLAGIIERSEGSITTGVGTAVSGPSRDRGMVFQSIDTPLFDWLTALGNVEFGLKIAGMRSRERTQRAREFLSLVGLANHERKFPREMSGGMKQRLQIARALATDPAILLMDEPFASVDAQTRRILQNEVLRIWMATQKTVVYVTHDIREALLLGQRIAVMSAGPSASIAEIYPWSSPYPRDELDPEFVACYRAIEARIVGEVSKAW
ncbi:MAG: ABC transporter ATP-binding protein [Actinomycetota bacterium]|nr:ABC transporter ATP-binding protein [Actinomycetota bacterium]